MSMSDIQLDAELEAASGISDAEPGDTVCLYAKVDSNKGGVISLTLEESDYEAMEEEDEDEEEMPPAKPAKKNRAIRAVLNDEEE